MSADNERFVTLDRPVIEVTAPAAAAEGRKKTSTLPGDGNKDGSCTNTSLKMLAGIFIRKLTETNEHGGNVTLVLAHMLIINVEDF